MAPTFVTLIAASIALIVCAVLIFHNDYEDGLFGRFGLALIGTACAVRVLGAIAAIETWTPIHISPMGLMLYTGIAIFLGRHLYRFLSYKRYGKFGWRRAMK